MNGLRSHGNGVKTKGESLETLLRTDNIENWKYGN